MKSFVYDTLLTAVTDSSFFNANMKHYSLFTKVSDLIDWAWQNWDDDTTRPHWLNGVKPQNAPYSFSKEWIDNEDFEADGFNESQMELDLAEYA